MQSHHISFMHLCCSRQQPEHRLPTGTPGCLRHQASVLSHYQKGGWNRWKCSAHTTVCLNAAVCKLNLKCSLPLQFLSLPIMSRFLVHVLPQTKRASQNKHYEYSSLPGLKSPIKMAAVTFLGYIYPDLQKIRDHYIICII